MREYLHGGLMREYLHGGLMRSEDPYGGLVWPHMVDWCGLTWWIGVDPHGGLMRLHTVDG